MTTINAQTSTTPPGSGASGEPNEPKLPGQKLPGAKLPPVPDLADLIPPHLRIRLAALAALFIALHWDILHRIYLFASTDGDWSHAFLIPVISLMFIHMHRDRLALLKPRLCPPALLLFIAALVGYVAAVYPLQSDMLKGYFMILELFAIVLFLAGPSMMRLLWFPILYLAFAVKIDPHYWSAFAQTMQHVAAQASVLMLNIVGAPMGIESSVSGTAIHVLVDGAPVTHEGRELGPLNVAEACSGMRMLIAFAAMGVAVAYLADRSWWSRLTLVALTVPIAVFVNVCRVTTLGVLYTIDPAYTRGDVHLFIGMLLLLPGLALFLLVGWLLSKIDPPKPHPHSHTNSHSHSNPQPQANAQPQSQPLSHPQPHSQSQPQPAPKKESP